MTICVLLCDDQCFVIQIVRIIFRNYSVLIGLNVQLLIALLRKGNLVPIAGCHMTMAVMMALGFNGIRVSQLTGIESTLFFLCQLVELEEHSN